MRLTSGARPGGGRGLICYLPLGDPWVHGELAEIYVEGGATVLEIGVPSSNPYLDGPVVTASMQRALAAGIDSDRAADIIAELRDRYPQHAMLWMTYPDAAGPGWPLAVARSGADGALFPEPARSHRCERMALESRGLAFAHFLASAPSLHDVCDATRASGYVMLQAHPGPTGSGGPEQGLAAQLRAIREAGVSAPLAVGFGIGGPDSARRVIEAGADAIVIGSALVRAALEGTEQARRLLRSFHEVVADA